MLAVAELYYLYLNLIYITCDELYKVHLKNKQIYYQLKFIILKNALRF